MRRSNYSLSFLAEGNGAAGIARAEEIDVIHDGYEHVLSRSLEAGLLATQRRKSTGPFVLLVRTRHQAARGARPSAPPGTAYPHALAQDAYYVPWRWALCPAGGNDVVQEYRHHLIFGLSGTKPLARKVDEVADDIRTRRAIENLPVLRGYTETRHKAKSWISNGAPSPVLRQTLLLDIHVLVTVSGGADANGVCARGTADLINCDAPERKAPSVR